MYPAPTLSQLTQDRQQDRLAAAAVHRLVSVEPGPHTDCADPPAHRGPARRGDRLTVEGEKRTPRRRLLKPSPGPSAPGT